MVFVCWSTFLARNARGSFLRKIKSSYGILRELQDERELKGNVRVSKSTELIFLLWSKALKDLCLCVW